MTANKGKRLRCSKCSKIFYDLGKKTKVCPKCREASLIPDGEIAPVRLRIERGQFNDFENGWLGGFASKNQAGSVFLKCKFEVTHGKYQGKRFSSLIGLFSPKGPWWGNEGRKTLRLILNSANGLSDEDYSQGAIASRQVDDFGTFHGLEFIAEISRKKGTDGVMRNEFQRAIGPDDPEYKDLEMICKEVETNPHQGADQPSVPPLWLTRV